MIEWGGAAAPRGGSSDHRRRGLVEPHHAASSNTSTWSPCDFAELLPQRDVLAGEGYSAATLSTPSDAWWRALCSQDTSLLRSEMRAWLSRFTWAGCASRPTMHLASLA